MSDFELSSDSTLAEVMAELAAKEQAEQYEPQPSSVLFDSFKDATVDPAELSAFFYKNHDAYKEEFFSKTARMENPDFHRLIEQQLSSGNRYNGCMVFRGGAKTSLLRIFTSKRIAYGISRTIVYVSNSQDAAERSVEWLMKQVEVNKKWADFYGLEPGVSKWSRSEIEIKHKLLDITIRVIAVGIKGQLRGINVDDYRPDLIVVDDADDEETTSTPEQCRKYVKLFFGSIVNSLTPSTENPHAMIAVLQTPLADGDIINTCLKDPAWHVIRVSCFDKEGNSTWPVRYPTETLRAEKAGMVAKRMLSVWMREMEVTIVSDEGCDFDANWLRFYDVLPEKPDGGVISIDPASSDDKRADDNAIEFWIKKDANYYLVAFSAEIGQTHIETSELLLTTFWPMAVKILGGRHPSVVVETNGYQKNLKVQIQADQRRYGVFFSIKAVKDRRNKRDRILQAYKGRASAGLIHCSKEHTKFIEQFSLYSKDIPHDDVLDGGAMAIDELDPVGTRFANVALGGVSRQFSNISMNRGVARLFVTAAQGEQ